MGRVEVKVLEEPLGDRLDVLVNQEQQARTRRQDEQSLGGFEEGNGTESELEAFKARHGCNLDSASNWRQGAPPAACGPRGTGIT